MSLEKEFRETPPRKIALITGASSGMGRHFALLISTEKETSPLSCNEIWLVARRESLLVSLKNEINTVTTQSGRIPEIKIFANDISGPGGALFIKSRLEEEYRLRPFTIGCLVNNAGFGTYGEFSQTDISRQMGMIDLNCTALTGITGFCIPYMQRGSRIIQIASLAAFLPLGNFAVYAACKSYVLSFSAALRAELRPRGIFVTAVCPGSVSTEFSLVASNGARHEVLHGKDAERVARHALKMSRKGKPYAICYASWRITAALSHFVPRALGAWYTYKFCKRPSNPIQHTKDGRSESTSGVSQADVITGKNKIEN